MINDDVLIVLNEREALKQQLAEELSLNLLELRLSSARINADSNLAEIVSERSPKVLVLDYLLGDFGTGLDLLETLRKSGKSAKTSIIIWTDELSTSVAVAAMKLGAKDFISMQTPRSLRQLLRSIESSLIEEQTTRADNYFAREKEKKGGLVFNSKPGLELLAKLESAAKRNPKILIFLGPWGSGRSSLARVYHLQRKGSAALREIDLDTWTGGISELLSKNSTNLLSLSKLTKNSPGATIVIEHAEFDDGSILDSLAAEDCLDRYPPTARTSLVIGTTSEAVALSYAKALSAEIIEVPTLKDRADDLLPFLQLLDVESQLYGKDNELRYSEELIDGLLRIDWPGNFKQFRASMLEFFTTRPEVDFTEKHSERALEVKLQLSAILEIKLRWERFYKREYYLPEPYVAKDALLRCNGDFRAAAALLGTGVMQVRRALFGKDNFWATSASADCSVPLPGNEE